MLELPFVVDVIGKLIELFKDLPGLTGARRREFFDKAVEPTFCSLNTVHHFYSKINLELWRGVIEIGSKSWTLDKSEDEKEVRKLKETYLFQRINDEYLRSALRDDAQTYLGAIKWPEERRFFTSIAYYFLGQGGIAPTDRKIDIDIGEVLRVGGKAQWDTPSTELYKKIREEHDCIELERIVKESRDALNQRYQNVRHQYLETQIAVLKRTLPPSG